jgi:hypothetical protein
MRWLTLTRALVLAAVLASLAAIAAVAALYVVIPRQLASPFPATPVPPPLWMLPDETPVEVTITASWQKVPLVTTVEALRRDHTVWRKMHFDDWDKVPWPLRDEALTRMLARYEDTLSGPSVWRTMNAYDWDEVPQPVRAMAFIKMVRHWTALYAAGVAHPLTRREVADTVSAIVMIESWFEHRAVQENAAGNRDLGLSQSSDYCRSALDKLAEGGWIDFRLHEQDYFDPFKATRVAVVWFDIMLDEAEGDLPLAVRAYHRGIYAAQRGEGLAYLENALDKRRRFIRNREGPPAWSFLWSRVIGRDAGLLTEVPWPAELAPAFLPIVAPLLVWIDAPRSLIIGCPGS